MLRIFLPHCIFDTVNYVVAFLAVPIDLLNDHFAVSVSGFLLTRVYVELSAELIKIRGQADN